VFIKDSYLLTASQTFELKDMQEITINIKLTKISPCYHTLLTGSVLHKNKPIKRAVVKVFDCKYNPLFHTMTNSRGVYQFKNILAPGMYKVVAAMEGYQTSRMRNIKIKANKVIRKSFNLKKCSYFMNGILYGKVIEVESRKPIEGASLYLKDKCGMVYKTMSNKDGQYIFYNIQPNKYELIVMKHRYISSNNKLSIDRNDRIMLNVDLKKQCNHK
jgi:hypothetical protein